ncbi:type II toxin-antitoxin system death-on-curing family toxin [bacterium]|nr:type II toxin-antitoxin system death-on-curing family toxin [bacterium]
MVPKLLSPDQVIWIHDELVSRTGEPLGILNESALLSAIAQPEMGRVYQEHDVFQMAAAYAYHLSRNHAFVEGNKRTAAMTADVFLAANGLVF